MGKWCTVINLCTVVFFRYSLHFYLTCLLDLVKIKFHKLTEFITKNRKLNKFWTWFYPHFTIMHVSLDKTNMLGWCGVTKRVNIGGCYWWSCLTFSPSNSQKKNFSPSFVSLFCLKYHPAPCARDIQQQKKCPKFLRGVI
jgi:hypothetical protein